MSTSEVDISSDSPPQSNPPVGGDNQSTRPAGPPNICDVRHPCSRLPLHVEHYGRCIFSVEKEILQSCYFVKQFNKDLCPTCKAFNGGFRKKCQRFIRTLELLRHEGSLPPCYSDVLEQVCHFSLDDAQTEREEEEDQDQYSTSTPPTPPHMIESQEHQHVESKDPIPITVQLMQDCCPDLLVEQERSVKSFSSRVKTSATTNPALIADPAVWGNFLRGLNSNLMIPSGSLSEVEAAISSSSFKNGPRNMFFDPHLTPTWLTMDTPSFKEYFKLDSFQVPAPSASQKVSVPPSSEDKNLYDHSIRAMEHITEARGLLNILSRPEAPQQSYDATVERLEELMEALAMETGALSRPTVLSYRKQFLQKAKLPASLLAEPIQGPTVLGTQAREEFNTMPNTMEKLTKSLVDLTKSAINSSRNSSRGWYHQRSRRGERASRRSLPRLGRYQHPGTSRGSVPSNQQTKRSFPERGRSSNKRQARGNSSRGRGRRQRV